MREEKANLFSRFWSCLKTAKVFKTYAIYDGRCGVKTRCMNNVIDVDIGGSHITAATVNLGTGQVLNESHKRLAVDATTTAPKLIRDWCSVVQAAAAKQDDNVQIGIAMPGPFNYKEGICLIKERTSFAAFTGST